MKDKTMIEKFTEKYEGDYHSHKIESKKVKCGRSDCIYNKPSLVSLFEFKVIDSIDKSNIIRVCSKKFVGIDENGKCFSYKENDEGEIE